MTVTTEKKHDPGADEKLDAAEVDVEDTTEDTTEDSTEDTAEERPAGRRWPRRVLISSAIVIFIAALAGSGLLGWQLWQQRQVDRAGEQAQQAAVAYAQVLTRIDSNKVDVNFAQVLDGSTGEFKDMYSQSSMQLRQLLIDNKASARGVVVDSAVQSASKDRSWCCCSSTSPCRTPTCPILESTAAGSR
ncbi:MAG: hypothetical protein ACXWDF_12020 [Aeromicrobium sp.]